MFIIRGVHDTDLDVVVSLDQGFPDFAGQSAVFGVSLQSMLINLDGFLWLKINTSVD